MSRRATIRFIRIICSLFACVCTCAESSVFGQQAPAPSQKERRAEQNSATNNAEDLPADRVPAVLKELREIRLLLEKQQSQLQLLTGQPSERVQMTVRDDWHTIGRDDAPVTIVEFTDLQCAFCRRFHTETFPRIKEDYIDTGKVRFVSRDMPLEFHQYAWKAAEATRCAGDQGKFWELRNAILELLVPPTREAMQDLAERLALDVRAFLTCLDSDKYKATIRGDKDAASKLQITGTPTFVIARTARDALEGVRLVGTQPYESFRLQLDALLDPGPTTRDDPGRLLQ